MNNKLTILRTPKDDCGHCNNHRFFCRNCKNYGQWCNCTSRERRAEWCPVCFLPAHELPVDPLVPHYRTVKYYENDNEPVSWFPIIVCLLACSFVLGVLLRII